jgi:pimeloyl-ACP methyl ester carboxylesterase
MSGGAPVIDGSPASGEGLQSDRELDIFGQGIGSAVDLDVSTIDIRACATRLRTLAGRVRAAAQSLRVALYGVSATAQFTSSGPAAMAEGWLSVADGERRAVELEDLAGRLDDTAQRYDEAEAANEARIWRIPRPLAPAWTPAAWVHIGVAWQAAWFDAWAHGQAFPTRHGVGMLVEETLWGLTGLNRPIPTVTRMVADAIGLVVSHRVRVEQVNPPGVGAPGPGSGVEEHGAIGDLEGVVTAIDGLYPDNGQVSSGTVRIDRVVGADGRESWLVLVPGTQGELVGEQPFDWAGNPGAMIGDVTGATAMVVQAMRLAGIRPGQPVVLAGHSQGGMVALNAANAVAEEYEVSGVLTVGAPVGLLDAPAGTEVLSLEHVEDPTPGADNTANPVSESWTTVERTLTSSIDADANGVWHPGGSHDTPTYADTARLVDASDDGAVLDYLTTVGSVLDPDATATSSYYQGARVP